MPHFALGIRSADIVFIGRFTSQGCNFQRAAQKLEGGNIVRGARGEPPYEYTLRVRSSVVEHSAAVRMVPGSNPGVPCFPRARCCVQASNGANDSAAGV